MTVINRKCPLCFSKKNTLIFSDKNRREGYSELVADYVKCNNCSMKYLTKIPDFKNFSQKYEEIYVEPNIEKLENEINENIQSNGEKVLDIGCNHGIELIKYKNKGFEIHGIDLNKRAIEDCKKYLPSKNFSVSTIENTKYQNNFFDIITTSHVLEHVYELDTFLLSVKDLLKKGGKLIIKVPNGGSLEMIIWGRYSSQSWVPFHINMFTKDSAYKILKKHGFQDISIKTNPIPWWWILSYRQYMGTINLEKGKTNFKQSLINKITIILSYPILFFISLLGYGEELEINATT